MDRGKPQDQGESPAQNGLSARAMARRSLALTILIMAVIGAAHWAGIMETIEAALDILGNTDKLITALAGTVMLTTGGTVAYAWSKKGQENRPGWEEDIRNRTPMWILGAAMALAGIVLDVMF